MDEQTPPESLEQLRLSFSYGSRSDMNFKFFKTSTDDEVGDFLQKLLHDLGDAYDSGDVTALIEDAYEAQVAGYAPRPGGQPPKFQFDDGPFTPLQASVASSTVTLFTTSGHFVAGDDPRPFGVDDMSQQEAMDRIGEFMSATPILSKIPADIEMAQLRVRHGGYDIRSALRDPNVTFPIERMREAVAAGRIGSLTANAFSFAGATSHGRLRKELPAWIDELRHEGAEAVVLVPI